MLTNKSIGRPGLRKVPASLFAVLIVGAFATADDRVRFNEDIRPLLSDRCFACHGPDGKRREAELRLDQRTGATGEAGGPVAIVPGKPGDSPLWERITSNDPDLQMPPPAAKKPRFTSEELALLKKWIEQGAEYEGHWAFLPLRRDVPPSVSTSAANPIDAFVRADLAERKVAPSPEAERETLIRRVSLDVTGLLPSPTEIDAFLQDTRPGAYERLVDRLLASPHYGERWGRHWLDQARYADSNGYAIDAPREMWPYRDWVIEALNRDLPFDQFTVEQLAGDLLPSPTKMQLIATGFHRNTLINQEGGTDREQFRVEANMDRANTTGAVWLGLTVGCAQCHTHKFDPITQREYYQLYAFFNSAQDANDRGPTVDVSRGEVFGNPAPPVREPSPLPAAEIAKLRAAWEDSTRARLEKSQGETTAAPVEWSPLTYVEHRTESKARLERLDDNSLLSNDRAAPNDAYVVTATSGQHRIAALRLRALAHESLPNRGPGRASNGNFVLSGVELRVGDASQSFARAMADHEQPGYPVSDAIDADAKTGWAINIAPGSKVKMNADHEAVFVLAQPVEVAGRTLTVRLSHEINQKYLIGRFALEVSSVAPVAVNADSGLLAALRKPADKRSKEEASLAQQAFEEAVPRAKPPKKAANPNVAAQMILRDLPQPRETFIMTRGDFTRPDKDAGPLSPGVLAAVAPALPETEQPRTRLDLAKWLVDSDNPLTARVTVNRMWMRYFGRGLVETEEDFGVQGSAPSHPALLDWLSAEFQRQGWSQKALHRLIVTSETYRQSSHERKDLAVKDPKNYWLARQQRLRMEAEIARDAALSASGLLNATLGGPSVHPPQPDGVYAFTQVNKRWPTETGPQRYRRALYTFFYRSAPYPLFATFDAPDFQTVCTRRLRSNTPLQALTIANDSVFIEFAQGLAQRLAAERPGEFDATLDDRIALATRLCFSRRPSEIEVRVLRGYVKAQFADLRQDQSSAEKLTTPVLRQTLPAAESAALVLLARALLNADNFITRE